MATTSGGTWSLQKGSPVTFYINKRVKKTGVVTHVLNAPDYLQNTGLFLVAEDETGTVFKVAENNIKPRK